VFAVLGVLLLAAAAILYWWVVPSNAQLPADTNTTRQYEGTVKQLLNAQALGAGDTARAIVRDIPATATRVVKVLATDGNVAQVSETNTLMAAGQTVGQTQAVYALDRKTMENPGNHPADWKVINQQGLTVTFPIGSKQQDYTGWYNESQISAPLKYVREEQHGGVDTYVYEGAAPASPIKDPQVLATLPQTLPVSALATASAILPIPDSLKSQLATLLPRLTAPVPLSYTFESTGTYWVEPTSGVVVDSKVEDIRKATVGLPGGVSIPGITVYDVVVQNTTQSVNDAASEASNDRNKIVWYGQTLPLIFLIAGAVLLIGGVLLIVFSRRRGTTRAEVSS